MVDNIVAHLIDTIAIPADVRAAVAASDAEKYLGASLIAALPAE